MVDNYTHGHQAAVVTSHARRTAEEYAPRTIELIKPSMSVLDVGAGPGSITAGFIKYLNGSGKIIAIDVEKDVLVQASTTMEKERVKLQSNVECIVAQGSVYDLQFPDKSIDIVHAHQVLQHLSDPVGALKEMKRVAKSFVSVRDVDYETWVWYPHNPRMDKWKDVYRKICRKNKAEPDAGKFYRKWLREAGFDVSRAKISANAITYATPERTREWGETWAKRTAETKLADQAVQYGFATREECKEMAAGWREWANHQDAALFYIDVSVVIPTR